MEFDPIGLATSSSSMAAMMVDPNSMVGRMIDRGQCSLQPTPNQVAADSMAASLQQHVMAMQHYQPSHFVQYPTMTHSFPSMPQACGASSIAAAAVIASGTLPLQSAGCPSSGLAGNLSSMARYPTLTAHGASKEYTLCRHISDSPQS